MAAVVAGLYQKNPWKGFTRKASGLSLIFQNLSAGVGTLGASSSCVAGSMPGCRGFVGPYPSTSLNKSRMIRLLGYYNRLIQACQA